MWVGWATVPRRRRRERGRWQKKVFEGGKDDQTSGAPSYEEKTEEKKKEKKAREKW